MMRLLRLHLEGQIVRIETLHHEEVHWELLDWKQGMMYEANVLTVFLAMPPRSMG